MQHLLINRFRGLFLGVAVAETHLRNNLLLRAANDALTSEEEHLPISQAELGWSQAIAASTEALINAQPPGPVLTEDLLLDEYQLGCQIAKMLPLELFWQDNLTRLEEQVCGHMLEGADPELQVGVMSIGIAIALICREQVSPEDLIPKILNHDCCTGTAIRDQLSQVQVFLKTPVSLTTVWNKFRSKQSDSSSQIASAIAIGFYCWLTSADSFSLTLSRSLVLPQPSLVPSLIASALSGLFNSVNNIPFPWQTPLFMASSTFSRQDILMQADQLMAFWSGYHTLDVRSNFPQSEQAVVSAPDVLRPRPKY